MISQSIMRIDTVVHRPCPVTIPTETQTLIKEALLAWIFFVGMTLSKV